MSKSAWSPGVTTRAFLRAFDEVVARKRALVARSQATRRQLDGAERAWRLLLDDESFVQMLHDESVETLPAPLSRRLRR